VLFLFAAASYTLQSSAFISKFLIGVFRTPEDVGDAPSWKRWIGPALLETSVFVALLALFMQIRFAVD